jgi:caa(3)-type oxidase subunit IV
MSSSDRRYVVLWAVLVGALLLSLALGALGATQLVVGMVFVLAAIKAYLVVAHFMHLSFEPRFVKLVLIGALAVIAVLYFGLVPDIIWVAGRKEGG